MSNPRYYSKTRWRNQPRDRDGKWKKVGAALSSTFKAATNAAVRGGFGLHAGGNIWKGTVDGSVTKQVRLPGGYAISSRVETRLHPIGKSPFEKGASKITTKAINSIGNKKVKNAVSIASGRGSTHPTKSGFVNQGSYFRTKTRKERLASERKLATKRLAKKKKLAATTASRAATASTLTGQKKARPQRRGR